ncbi:hypothetical protein F5887DRAFT_1088170 [Amanita rubescens]|nr:hypothetical protein F5887DRAFT_1088170 [Amanita rubescens]
MSIQPQDQGPRSDRKMNVKIAEIIGELVYDPAPYSGSSRIRTLFNTLFLRALDYALNPRNLETYWKPVYSLWLDQMAQDHENLNCFQEQPVWWALYDLPTEPERSITAAQGGFITLYPDLGLVKVSGKRDTWMLIGELKRSPKRVFIFNADLKRKSKGWIDLHTKVTTAIDQVQQQAYLALHKNLNQTEIDLFAACGPFWTYVFASRNQIDSLFDEETDDPHTVARRLLSEKTSEQEEEDDMEDGDDDDDPDYVDEEEDMEDGDDDDPDYVDQEQEMDDDDDQEQEMEVVDDIRQDRDNDNVDREQEIADNIHKIPNVDMTRHDLFGWNAKLHALRKRSKGSTKLSLELSDLEKLTQETLRSSLPWESIMFAGTHKSNNAINAIREKINGLAALSWAKST